MGPAVPRRLPACVQTGYTWARWCRPYQVSLLLVALLPLGPLAGLQACACSPHPHMAAVPAGCLAEHCWLAEAHHNRLPASAEAIGFNVETVTYKNIKFQVWDLGGQTSIRPYWRCYYP